MKGGGNFTVYDMLIGNPSFVVEKEKTVEKEENITKILKLIKSKEYKGYKQK